MSLEKLYTICWEHSDIQIEVEKILKQDEPGKYVLMDGRIEHVTISNAACSIRGFVVVVVVVVFLFYVHGKHPRSCQDGQLT